MNALREKRPLAHPLAAPATRLGVLLAAALLASCGGARLGQAPPAPVTAVDAVVKDVPSVVTAIGTVEAYNTVSVKALVPGQLTGVHFKEGQDVRKGDLLFTIDPRPYQVALEQAKARLARDLAQLQSASAQEGRYADLVKKDFITEQQNDDARAAAESLKATVKSDQEDVEDARLNLEYCFIRAPMDGRLGTLLVQEGNLVKANDTQVLVTLNQITPVYVTFSVPEEALTQVRRASARRALAAEATLPADTGSRFSGTLSFIDNAVNSSTGTILLKATFPNEDRGLWPGQYAQVKLTLEDLVGAVVVPAEAVQKGQQGDFLYVVKPDMTAEMRSVKTGQVLDGEAVIEDGVKGGEKVVVDGQLRLFPGAAVEITGGVQQAASAAAPKPRTSGS